MVRNLLDNAIRYTKAAGTVVASVSADDGSVVLRVTDTGTGIPSKELGRVFERFYRVDRARSRETGGTGLGLAIVRHVAENHGGTVTVESELGVGSTFEVRLPSAIADADGSDGRLTGRPAYAAGPMTTLFLIRHGLTAVTGKTLYGRTPGVPLDDRGRAQAEALAERFAAVRLTAVYSSPLDRCMQTMAPLAERHRLDVVPREGLVEMDVGTWTGRPLAQVRRTRLWKELIHRPSHFRFPDGESFADAQARALTEIDAIAARHPRGRVAVGSHGDIIRMLIAHFSGAHLDLFQRTMADPASVSVVHLGEARSARPARRTTRAAWSASLPRGAPRQNLRG